MGVAGGTIERSCYSPHYVNTERDYERDYQATLPQGRTAAGGCKPRHGRDDRKRERSFSGLRTRFYVFFCPIAISSALNRFVQLDAPFAIILFYLHGLFHLKLQLY